MLIHTSTPRAIEYFLQLYDSVATLDELMQLAVIELVRKDLKESKGETAQKVCMLSPCFLRERVDAFSDSSPDISGPFSSFSTPRHILSNTKPPLSSPLSPKTPRPSKVRPHTHLYFFPRPIE
jgi:hypothetical protein